MREQAHSFWCEVRDAYLSYMVVGLAALPFATSFAVLENRHLISPALLSSLIAAAILCAWVALRLANRPSKRPSGTVIISFQVTPAATPLTGMSAAAAAMVLMVCLTPTHGEPKVTQIAPVHLQSVGHVFVMKSAA